jgi:hypothetical protein
VSLAAGGIGNMKQGAPRRLLASVMAWFIINLAAIGVLLVVHFASDVSSLKGWADIFAVTTNLLAGGLVSFLFYFLVVHLPESRRKSIIKNNLQRMYRSIKEDILWAVVHASVKGGRRDLTADFETIEKLMMPGAFKEAFQGGREGDEGFYAFANQMSDDTPEFRLIVQNLQMLSKQIEFVLHNYNIRDQKAFDFFKRLELVLVSLQAKGPGYDESKQLCSFIWDVYAGWDWVQGDRGYDQIQKMISEL